MTLLINQGIIVGVCHIIVMGEKGIYGIVIDRKYRGYGLGYILSEKTISLATNYGVKKIILKVDEDNVQAINLFKKLHFKIVGTRSDNRVVNGKKTPVRAIIMERNLKV